MWVFSFQNSKKIRAETNFPLVRILAIWQGRGRLSSSHQPLWSQVCRKWLTLPLKWFATKYQAVHAWPHKYCQLLQFRPRTFSTTKAIQVAYVTTISTTRGLRYYHRHHYPWPMSTLKPQPPYICGFSYHTQLAHIQALQNIVFTRDGTILNRHG